MFKLYLCICVLSYFFVYDKINNLDHTKTKAAMQICKIEGMSVGEFKKLFIIATTILIPILPILLIIAMTTKKK